MFSDPKNWKMIGKQNYEVCFFWANLMWIACQRLWWSRLALLSSFGKLQFPSTHTLSFKQYITEHNQMTLCVIQKPKKNNIRTINNYNCMKPILIRVSFRWHAFIMWSAFSADSIYSKHFSINLYLHSMATSRWANWLIKVEYKKLTTMENSEQKNTKPRPKQKIKILELARENFAAIGISPILVDQPYSFNRKILFGFLILTSSFICNLMYIIRGAKTFAEYTQSIYMFSVPALLTLVWLAILRNVTNLINFTNGLENLANTSK